VVVSTDEFTSTVPYLDFTQAGGIGLTSAVRKVDSTAEILQVLIRNIGTLFV